jgi:hypothetical protein
MPALQGRILLAVSAQALTRLQDILAGYDTRWARTIGEARAALEAGHFDLAIVGSHFDESHTFDIVGLVRERDANTRIVCVRGRPFRPALGRSTIKAFEAASEVLGASLVVDLLDYPDDEGGNRAVRALIDRQITSSSFSSPRAA